MCGNILDCVAVLVLFELPRGSFSPTNWLLGDNDPPAACPPPAGWHLALRETVSSSQTSEKASLRCISGEAHLREFGFYHARGYRRDTDRRICYIATVGIGVRIHCELSRAIPKLLRTTFLDMCMTCDIFRTCKYSSNTILANLKLQEDHCLFQSQELNYHEDRFLLPKSM